MSRKRFALSLSCIQIFYALKYGVLSLSYRASWKKKLIYINIDFELKPQNIEHMKRNCFLCTMFRLKGKLMGPEDLIN